MESSRARDLRCQFRKNYRLNVVEEAGLLTSYLASKHDRRDHPHLLWGIEETIEYI
jgi:hypothetical protein